LFGHHCSLQLGKPNLLGPIEPNVHLAYTHRRKVE